MSMIGDVVPRSPAVVVYDDAVAIRVRILGGAACRRTGRYIGIGVNDVTVDDRLVRRHAVDIQAALHRDAAAVNTIRRVGGIAVDGIVDDLQIIISECIYAIATGIVDNVVLDCDVMIVLGNLDTAVGAGG